VPISGDSFLNNGLNVSISGDYAISGTTIFKHEDSEWVENETLSITSWSASFMNGEYLIIGDSANSEMAYVAGAAYIFKREDNTWVKQATLRASDFTEKASFGTSVSISGDYAAIGAPRDKEGGYYSLGDNAGAVYIFKRDGDNWVEEQKLIADDTEAWAYFGISVSLNGDYLIVGARGHEEIIATDHTYKEVLGKAYIYKQENGVWVKQAKLTIDDFNEQNDYMNFGGSVAISDKYAAVGAWKSRGSSIYIKIMERHGSKTRVFRLMIHVSSRILDRPFP
jgi:hypothetical protein